MLTEDHLSSSPSGLNVEVGKLALEGTDIVFRIHQAVFFKMSHKYLLAHSLACMEQINGLSSCPHCKFMFDCSLVVAYIKPGGAPVSIVGTLRMSSCSVRQKAQKHSQTCKQRTNGAGSPRTSSSLHIVTGTI